MFTRSYSSNLLHVTERVIIEWNSRILSCSKKSKSQCFLFVIFREFARSVCSMERICSKQTSVDNLFFLCFLCETMTRSFSPHESFICLEMTNRKNDFFLWHLPSNRSFLRWIQVDMMWDKHNEQSFSSSLSFCLLIPSASFVDWRRKWNYSTFLPFCSFLWSRKSFARFPSCRWSFFQTRCRLTF